MRRSFTWDTSPFLARLQHFWRLLTEPVDSVQGFERRFKSRWLATALITLTPLGFLIAVAPPLMDYDSIWEDKNVMVTLGAMALWAVPYVLSRIGRYQAGATFATGIASIVILTLAITSNDKYLLKYLLIPVLFTSVLLPTPAIWGLVVVNAAAILFSSPFIPEATLRNILLDSLSFFLIGFSLILLVSHHRDVLERHRVTALETTNAALLESETQYRSLVEQSNDAIYVNQQGRFKYANRQFEELFGYTFAELTAPEFTPIEKIIAPESRELIRERQQQIKRGEIPPPRHEFVGLTRDQQKVEIEASVSYVPYKGEMAAQSILRDITERKQVEQERLAFALEKERVNILADFIQNASHEFRTPLTIIKTNLYLLGKTDQPEKRDNLLEVLGQEASYLAKLINTMFTMSELDRVTRFAFAPTDINRLLRDIQTRLSSSAGKKRLTFTLNLDDLPPVHGDETGLHQALVNLIENAIHYTPEGDTITIETFVSDEHAIIAIMDTGVGISEADQERIFERFFRTDAARTTRGTGLGLSIAKKIVEMHGGRIEVESILAEGSTFRVLLPIIMQ